MSSVVQKCAIDVQICQRILLLCKNEFCGSKWKNKSYKKFCNKYFRAKNSVKQKIDAKLDLQRQQKFCIKNFKQRNLCAYIVTIQYQKFIILYIDNFSLSHAFSCSAVILLEICVNFSLSFFSHFFRATFFSEIYVFFCAMFALNLSICHPAQIPHVNAKQINSEWKFVEFATKQKFVCKIFLSRLNPIKKSLYEHMHFYHLN